MLESRLRPPPGSPAVEWVVTPGLTDYAQALAEMESRADAIAAGRAAERVWLLEHPPLYTAGTSAKEADLLDARFPVFRAGRGGQFTYHGPGQRVAYVMLDLKRRRPDVRAFVGALEGWLIDALARASASPAKRARTASASGSRGPTSRAGSTARRPRTRSPRSAFGCAAGCRSTASRSTSRRTSSISGHRPLRRRRSPLRRDQPSRSRPGRHDGRCRQGAARGVRSALRADRFGASRLRSNSAAHARRHLADRPHFAYQGAPPLEFLRRRLRRGKSCPPLPKVIATGSTGWRLSPQRRSSPAWAWWRPWRGSARRTDWSKRWGRSSPCSVWRSSARLPAPRGSPTSLRRAARCRPRMAGSLSRRPPRGLSSRSTPVRPAKAPFHGSASRWVSSARR